MRSGHAVHLTMVAEGLKTKEGGGEANILDGRAKNIKNIFLRHLHDAHQHGASCAQNIHLLGAFQHPLKKTQAIGSVE